MRILRATLELSLSVDDPRDIPDVGETLEVTIQGKAFKGLPIWESAPLIYPDAMRTTIDIGIELLEIAEQTKEV